MRRNVEGVFGAQEGTRTLTRLLSQAPEACVSTSFTTWALAEYGQSLAFLSKAQKNTPRYEGLDYNNFYSLRKYFL